MCVVSKALCQEKTFYDSIIFMKVTDTIIQIDATDNNPLRAHSRPITQEEFGGMFLRDVIRSMKQALAKEEDGVAIAAPQIALPLRIFVVAESSYPMEAKQKPLVFINPKIIKRSKKNMVMQEGCLSVRWIYGKTKRSVSATVEAYDEDGHKFTYGGSGLLAHIFQHEIDHLDGILFIDHGFDLEEYTEEEVREAAEKSKKESVDGIH
jgi:peptide deformylase